MAAKSSSVTWRVHLGPAGADDGGGATPGVRIGWVTLHHLPQKGDPLGVDMGYRQRADATVVTDEMDGAPVGQTGYRQIDDLGERELVVEERGERRGRLGHERQAFLRRLGGAPRRLLRFHGGTGGLEQSSSAQGPGAETGQRGQKAAVGGVEVSRFVEAHHESAEQRAALVG